MANITTYDAVIVGSGPNGLAAAITLAQTGKSVKVFESKPTIGGGMRTQELTLPGYLHDVCSAIHPLGAGSPFFQSLPLHKYGLKWLYPEYALTHPLDDGSAVILQKSIQKTAQSLAEDGPAYQQLIKTYVENWPRMAPDLLGPFSIPKHPFLMAKFGLQAMQPAQMLAKRTFKGEKGRALLAGLAAHSIMPLNKPLTSAIGLVLGVLGHAIGWPLPEGGSQQIAESLGAYLKSLGGEIETGKTIQSLEELPSARTVLLDITPKQLLDIAGKQLPEWYQDKLRSFRYGPGVFKLDIALNGPVPWKNEECLKAGTVHLGGTMEEIAESEEAMWNGTHHPRPYVLVAQQSLVDSSRSPENKHALWAYCHVPSGSTEDRTDAIINQIERFAPGFRERILKIHKMNTADFQSYNPNYIGGDINGGIQDIRQLFTRPTARIVPYSTPLKGIYLCSSSTPPGGGVHGMCGYHAAQAALKSCF